MTEIKIETDSPEARSMLYELEKNYTFAHGREVKASEGEPMPPAGYSKLPDGVVCKCFKMWSGSDGSHWCCIRAPSASPAPDPVRMALADEAAAYFERDYFGEKTKGLRDRIVAALRAAPQPSAPPRILELERVLREARRCTDPDGDPTRLTHAQVTKLIDATLASPQSVGNPVGLPDREAIMFEFYRFSRPMHRDWPRDRLWEDFQACRGSINWERCEQSADAILSIPAEGEAREPVAWRWRPLGGSWQYADSDASFPDGNGTLQPLYAPPEGEGWQVIDPLHSTSEGK